MITREKPPVSVDDFVKAAPLAESALSDQEEGYKHYPLRIPRSLWKTAKLAALERDITLQQLILDAIRAYVSK